MVRGGTSIASDSEVYAAGGSAGSAYAAGGRDANVYVIGPGAAERGPAYENGSKTMAAGERSWPGALSGYAIPAPEGASAVREYAELRRDEGRYVAMKIYGMTYESYKNRIPDIKKN